MIKPIKQTNNGGLFLSCWHGHETSHWVPQN
jgi:hypothetical protein